MDAELDMPRNTSESFSAAYDSLMRLELAKAKCDALAKMLRDVMATLARTCPSDEHRKVYGAAYAMIAEYGLVLDETTRERMEIAYAQWEAKKEVMVMLEEIDEREAV